MPRLMPKGRVAESPVCNVHVVHDVVEILAPGRRLDQVRQVSEGQPFFFWWRFIVLSQQLSGAAVILRGQHTSNRGYLVASTGSSTVLVSV